MNAFSNHKSLVPSGRKASIDWIDFENLVVIDDYKVGSAAFEAFAVEHALREAEANSSQEWQEPDEYTFVLEGPTNLQVHCAMAAAQLVPLATFVVKYAKQTGERIAFSGRSYGPSELALPAIYCVSIIARDRAAISRFVARARKAFPQLFA